MWLTGLLMVNLPSWSFLIYGVSWWLALVGIAYLPAAEEDRAGS